VNPVMSALLQNGLDVTALHNHFFWEQPRILCTCTGWVAPQISQNASSQRSI
jgi:hypothetical protein